MTLTEHGIDIPDQAYGPGIDFIRLLNGPGFQIQTIVSFLVNHVSDENRCFPTFVKSALMCLNNTHLIPDLIHTMVEMNCVDAKTNFLGGDDKTTFLEEKELIETTWQYMTSSLDTAYRKPLAIVTLAAIKRRFGEQALDLTSNSPAIARNSMLTAEAMLLQRESKSSPHPIQEMLAYIG